MQTVDMTKIYQRYKGKWVALKSPRNPVIVASGKTLKETLGRAQKRGVNSPLVTQIPREIIPIVGSI